MGEHIRDAWKRAAEEQTAAGIGLPDGEPTEAQMLALLWQPQYIPVLEDWMRGNFDDDDEDGALKAAYEYAQTQWECADCGEICGDDEQVWECACEPMPPVDDPFDAPEDREPEGEQAALML